MPRDPVGGFEADLRVSALRLFATKGGFTTEEKSLPWAVERGLVELLPDGLAVFTEKGLDVTDAILAGDGYRLAQLM